MPGYDLIIIGAGPGGYVAAIRAAQLGLSVACVEKEKSLGGTCLRIGCIPSKALLEASERYAETGHDLKRFGVIVGGVSLDLKRMMKHKDTVVKANTVGVDGLFKKNKVRRYLGTARISSPGVVLVTGEKGEERLEAEEILIATGSEPATIPGVVLDGDRIGTSTEALAYPEIPEHLVVIGAGYIGLEMGSVWHRLGSKVVVLEYLDRILPGMDDELAAEASKLLVKQGLDIRTGCRVTGATASSDGATVRYTDSAGKKTELQTSRVLVSVGRRPFTDGLGLAEVGVTIDKRGFIEIGADFETSVPGIRAVGDVVRGPMLAHKGSEEGVAVVEHIATGYGHVNYDAIPSVCYTEPEIAAVGKTEQQLESEGVPFKKGKYPFRFNGRARALAKTDGFIKVLAHAETDRLLGVHAIGPRAGDLIAEAATAIDLMASAEDIARGCHAHPTLAEAFKEAALDVAGIAVHK
jgi:dihydrolipoamide dehydrogenase